MGQPAKCILMAFCWQANDGPTLNAGIGSFVIFQTSIAKESYSFCDFPEDPFSPLWIRAWIHIV